VTLADYESLLPYSNWLGAQKFKIYNIIHLCTSTLLIQAGRSAKSVVIAVISGGAAQQLVMTLMTGHSGSSYLTPPPTDISK
jgi:hypothetical protein